MSRVNESCRTWINRVIHINESCHVWISDLAHEWVMLHLRQSCHTCMSHVPYAPYPLHPYPLSGKKSQTIKKCILAGKHMYVWEHTKIIFVSCHVTFLFWEGMNEACDVWMCHATREWIMLHVNVSCHTWVSRATREWIMSQVNETCHMWMSYVKHECVMSIEWVTSHIHGRM